MIRLKQDSITSALDKSWVISFNENMALLQTEDQVKENAATVIEMSGILKRRNLKAMYQELKEKNFADSKQYEFGDDLEGWHEITTWEDIDIYTRCTQFSGQAMQLVMKKLDIPFEKPIVIPRGKRIVCLDMEAFVYTDNNGNVAYPHGNRGQYAPFDQRYQR